MEVITGGVRTVYISGTASIDEAGHTIHLGDAAGQIERTVRNIEALIGTRGLTLNDIRQATVFLKHPGDLSRFRELCADNAFGRLGVCMAADVCRADLLFEIDAVAAEG
jgi:enamine deaminase RidA (YjgF/YER057c/UK114 family)